MAILAKVNTYLVAMDTSILLTTKNFSNKQSLNIRRREEDSDEGNDKTKTCDHDLAIAEFFRRPYDVLAKFDHMPTPNSSRLTSVDEESEKLTNKSAVRQTGLPRCWDLKSIVNTAHYGPGAVSSLT